MNKSLFITLSICLIASTNLLFAQGFESTPTVWEVPEGGQISGGHEQGFLRPFDESAIWEDVGNMLWSVDDMNGDGRKDLIVHAVVDSISSKTFRNPDNSQYWKVYLNNGEGFDTTPIKWSLPYGGVISKDVYFGYWGLRKQNIGSTNYVGTQLWDFQDMDGDGKGDLVITAERDIDTISFGYTKTFGTTQRYWKVYKNTGSGFSSTATQWNLPKGGYLYGKQLLGFYLLKYDFDNILGLPEGSSGWAFKDMNGDKRPDLVVTGEITPEKNAEVFNIKNPYWKVYLNNGNGFDSEKLWNVPNSGGETIIDYTLSEDELSYIETPLYLGFNNLSDNSIALEANNSEAWDVIDMDGDGKPEIIVTLYRKGDYGVAFGTTKKYWKYYHNNGNGFDRVAKEWTLPQGGQTTNDVNQGFNSWYDLANNYNDVNSELWYMYDFNADKQPDLVVFAKKDSNNVSSSCFGQNKNQWKIYENNGMAFETEPIYWNLPEGGVSNNDVSLGYNSIAYTGGLFSFSSVDKTSNYWGCFDMNGDTKPDLVVTAGFNGDTTGVFIGDFPYWKVYMNTIATGLEIGKNETSLLNVYPNLANEYINIQHYDYRSKHYSISTSTGLIVMQGQMDNQTININISHLNTGLYLIHIDETGETKKFIKN